MHTTHRGNTARQSSSFAANAEGKLGRRRFPARSTLAALALAAGSLPAGAAIIWSNPANSNWATIPAGVHAMPLPQNLEAADDFMVNGSIERIVVHGYNGCLVQCFPPPLVGVFVRFYGWTASGPGALQQEYFLAAGDPNLIYDAGGPDDFDIRLPTAFAASGQHFLSVAPQYDEGFYWGWWVSNHLNPTGSPLWVRDNLAGGTWGPYPNVLGGDLHDDLTFTLYGAPGTDPAGNCGSWVVTPTPEPAGSERAILRSVSAITEDDVWAVGESSRIVTGSFITETMTMHYDGTAWTIVPSPSPSPYPQGTYATLDAVAAISPTNVWAAGGARVQGVDGFVGTHLLIMHWDGSGWTVMQNLPQQSGGSGENIRAIEVIAPNDIWFFGDWIMPQTGLALHWNGSSFTRVPMPFLINGGHGIEAAAAVSANDIWAVGGGGDGDWIDFSNIFHWNGSTWSHVPGPTPGYHQRLWDVHAFASDDVWAVGSYQEGNEILPLMLHWNGAGWTQFMSPAGGGSLAAFSPTDMISIGGGIARWDGTSWQSEPIGGLEDVIGPSLGSLAVTGPCEVWGVGREIVGGDLYTFAARLNPQQAGFRGDMNCDGVLSVGDIGGFVLALTDSTAYAAANPDCLIEFADVNGDGVVSVGDIALFVQMIAGA